LLSTAHKCSCLNGAESVHLAKPRIKP
jgi:hypothetical protein